MDFALNTLKESVTAISEATVIPPLRRTSQFRCEQQQQPQQQLANEISRPHGFCSQYSERKRYCNF